MFLWWAREAVRFAHPLALDLLCQRIYSQRQRPPASPTSPLVFIGVLPFRFRVHTPMPLLNIQPRENDHQHLEHDASSLRLSARLPLSPTSPLPLSSYNNPASIRHIPLRTLFDHVETISGHPKSRHRQSWSRTRRIPHQWTTWLQ